jgi:phosphopantetheinyl transferase (holo-ACP synthase)
MPSESLLTRVATCDEIARLCGGDDARWLSHFERETLRSFRDSSRRRSWLAGRVLAKTLVMDSGAAGPIDPRDIEIDAGGAIAGTARFGNRLRERVLGSFGISLAPPGRAQRPSVRIAGAVQPWCLSISHTDVAAAALSLDPSTSVGIDLACGQQFAHGFLTMWFTDREQRQLEGCEPRQVAARWAIKEAVYKAFQQGESFTPRRIEVLCDAVPLSTDRVTAGVTCRYHGFDLTGSLSIEAQFIAGHVLAIATIGKAHGKPSVGLQPAAAI